MRVSLVILCLCVLSKGDTKNNDDLDDVSKDEDFINTFIEEPKSSRLDLLTTRSDALPPVYTTCPTAYLTTSRNLCTLHCTSGTSVQNPGWVLLQARERDVGLINFNRTYREFETGFEDSRYLTGYWLGLRCLHAMTRGQPAELLIELRDAANRFMYARYRSFTVGGQETGYKLHVGGFEGTGGDTLQSSEGMAFSAYDRDRDEWREGNCAARNQGGWWYSRCLDIDPMSSLNSLFTDGAVRRPMGVQWSSWATPNPVIATRMLFRPIFSSMQLETSLAQIVLSVGTKLSASASNQAMLPGLPGNSLQPWAQGPINNDNYGIGIEYQTTPHYAQIGHPGFPPAPNNLLLDTYPWSSAVSNHPMQDQYFGSQALISNKPMASQLPGLPATHNLPLPGQLAGFQVSHNHPLPGQYSGIQVTHSHPISGQLTGLQQFSKNPLTGQNTALQISPNYPMTGHSGFPVNSNIAGHYPGLQLAPNYPITGQQTGFPDFSNSLQGHYPGNQPGSKPSNTGQLTGFQTAPNSYLPGQYTGLQTSPNHPGLWPNFQGSSHQFSTPQNNQQLLTKQSIIRNPLGTMNAFGPFQ